MMAMTMAGKCIERLPEDVRNSARSGIVLFDLTRVVEELVYNSLDAGANKVSVFIGVQNSYVKVADDGCGITRDGLVLLGERYATSKLHHLDDMNAAAGTFGFRGEALSSLSDISLLEVCSKAYGCPNGYRKVMKGRKCLYLGINNDRKDVGTTVIARDLFYNQPVRRKHIHSSPKKVLYDAKKSVLQIALAHSRACFKVVDIDSEVELLCTNPSSSPLALLMSCSGIGNSSCLREVNAKNGELKLSGYFSDPLNGFAAKAIQYVYINSRFISKCPIHKLLNQLALTFESLVPQKAQSESQKGKRSRLQACPSYILNIICPRSIYDLAFEPSKTVAVFKDWSPILDFVEHIIQHFWRENIGCGESFCDATELLEKDDVWHKSHKLAAEEDWLESPKFVKKCRTQNHQFSSHRPSFLEDMLGKDHPDIWQPEVHESQELHKYFADFDEQITIASVSQTDHSKNSWEDTLLGNYDGKSIPDKVCSLDNKCTADFKNQTVEDIDSVWTYKPSKVEFYVDNGPMGNTSSCESHEFVDDWQDASNKNKSYLQRCSSGRGTQHSALLFTRDEDCIFPSDSSKFKLTWESTDDMVDCFGVGLDSQRCDIFTRSLGHNEASNGQPFTKLMRDYGLSSNYDPPAGALAEPLTCHAKSKFKVEDAPYGSFTDNSLFDSSHESRNSNWCFEASELFQSIDWDVKHFTNKSKHEYDVLCDEKVTCGGFSEHEDQDSQLKVVLSPNNSSLEKVTSICTNLDFDRADSYEGFHAFSQRNELGSMLSQNHWMLSEKTDHLHSNSPGNDNLDIDKYNFQAKVSFRRSRSAPPFHRQKRKFVSLNCNSMMNEKEMDPRIPHDSIVSEEYDQSEHALQSSERVSRTTFTKPEVTENVKVVVPTINTPFIGTKRENQDTQSSGEKWRNGCTQMKENKSNCTNDLYKILDISSGYLHLAADSLVPSSIGKESLQTAKVLQQVDKKFIPIVANRTLALIDQHAADERIRLEELRGKVLSGEGKTVTYLNAEHELILPEMGYQLLHNYAEQIKDWGWICSIDDQGSKSFKKNLTMLQRQPAVVKLLAVPCILGVNLSDVDLLEFLQQLADTDGSSTIPPSVIKVLNLKACRGAIMFGDSLLPSECSLIVDELKQTSLCFQCAHGRPTTVPLLDLEALHKHIAKIELNNPGPHDLGHGLYRHGISLERAFQRLSRANR